MRCSELLVLDQNLVHELVWRRQGWVVRPIGLKHVVLDQPVSQHLLQLQSKRNGVVSWFPRQTIASRTTDTAWVSVFRTVKILAIFCCCGMEQWFSMDRMTGYGDLTNALLLIASTTPCATESTNVKIDFSLTNCGQICLLSICALLHDVLGTGSWW